MDSTAAIFLGVSLMVIMFGMGLALTPLDFKRVLIYPKAVFTGLLNQIVLLPLIALVLLTLTSPSPVVAVGIMLLAAAPGGATSNLITHLAKGDTALSVTLTALSSLITIITLPLIVQFSLQKFAGDVQEVQLDVPSVIAQLFMIIIIPVAAGMFVRKRVPRFAARMDRPVRIASATMLILVMIGLIIKEKANILDYFVQAGLLALSLNVLTMVVGLLTARTVDLTFRQSLTISIESGLQNGTLAIAVAAVTLNNTGYGIAPAVYGLIMFGTAFIAIGIGNRRVVDH